VSKKAFGAVVPMCDQKYCMAQVPPAAQVAIATEFRGIP
jgi:hypothetical protein